MTKSGERPRATVVGAGFTGLITAYALERKGYAVEVFERGEREGGMIATTATEFGIAESGANAFLNSARVEALLMDLEIPLVLASRASRARFIFRGGAGRRWPIGLGASLRVVVFVLNYLFRRHAVAPKARETLSEYGRRVFGDEATEYLLLPAFQGIYAGEGSRLSATLLLASLFKNQKRPKPKFVGSVSAPGGMGEVMTKLRSRLESRGVRFHFGKDAPAVSPEYLTYYCGSAPDTAASLARIAPKLSRLIGRVEMLPLVSVTAFFPRDPGVRRGFGVLFPAREGFRSLGVLYNHVIFPGRVARPEIASETWILGGASKPEAAGLGEDELVSEILADRSRLHGESAGDPPLGNALHRWGKGIPYYTTELEGLLEELSRLAPESGNLRIMGNYLGGIGLTKILDRVAEEIGGLP